MPSRTLDRGPPGAHRAPIHVVGQIGPKRKLRPDGSLLCEDVPIARTGTMLYRPGEVPLQPPTRPGAAQVLYVTRDATTLFAPEVLGGIIGAPITIDHPAADVTPQNWSHLAQGFVLDAWQGDGDDADIMFADLVITNRNAIAKVNREGIREVSLGYSAEYEQTGDGEGRQHNIIPNHLALVERGRCGPRCAIGDRHPKDETMARNTGTPNGGPRPRVRLEAIENLRNALDDLTTEDEGGEDDDGVHVHVHMGDRTTDSDPPDDVTPRARRRTDDALEERIGDIEEGMLQFNDTLQQILARLPAPNGGGGGDGAGGGSGTPTGDSAALQTSFTQYLSQAEILVPGYKPAKTFDSALPRATTVDAMCSGRRAVLTLLNAQAEGQRLLKSVTEDGFDIDTADCATVATAFKAAATVKAAANNRSSTGDRMGIPPNAAAQNVAPHGGMKRVSDADINAANAAYWAKQNA